MPEPILYPTLTDAKYVNQFVGSTYPELKEMQDVLNKTWDAAKQTDINTKALALDIYQNAHEKDRQTAYELYTDINNKLAKRAESGRYENELHNTIEDAKIANVGVAKLALEKKKIDEALKAIDESKDYNASQKQQLKNMTLYGQEPLSYNPNTGAIEGQGFKSDVFAKDFDFSTYGNEMSKGFVPDKTSWSKGEFKNINGKLMFVSKNGEKTFVNPTHVEDYVREILKSNPDAQGDIDRRARQLLNKNGIDWRNPDEKDYILAKDIAEKKAIEPVVKAMANKFGFEQKDVKAEYKFLPKEYQDNKIGDVLNEKLPQTRPLTVETNTAINYPELTYNDIKGAKNLEAYNKYLESKGVNGLDRARALDDFRIIKSNVPIENKITSLTSKNPLLASLVNQMKGKKIKINEENLVDAYNSARKLLLHKYPLAETFSKDFEEADRYGLFGADNQTNFPEATKAMKFKDSKTGEEYTFNDIPLPEEFKQESWLGKIGIGSSIETIGDLIKEAPEKVKDLKQNMANPARILPFGSKGGVGLTIGDKLFTSSDALTKEQSLQNEAIYKLNQAAYGPNGASVLIDVSTTFLSKVIPGVNKIQAIREPVIDKSGKFVGFETNVYEINKNGTRKVTPVASLDAINNEFRKIAITTTDPFSVKGTSGSGADFNQTKAEASAEEEY